MPRYGSPKSGLPDRRARDNRFRDGNRDRSVAPGLRLRQAASRTQRDSASWTWGRGERRFNGGDPWGVNAAGRRIYGTWRRNHFAPTCFYWGYVPAWCRWGYFCYPAYASWYYPYYCWPSLWSSSFVFHWNSQDIYRNRLWYWPSSVYTPSIVYYDYDYPPDYYDAGGYAVVESGAAAPTAIRVGRGAGRAAPPSKETLAERHVALGDFYFKEERYDDAAESYMRALAYAPDDPGLHFVLADALFAVGDYHYAAFMIRKAIDLDPEMVTVVADKRGFYAKPERFDAQMETLRRYLAEKPYDAAAHLVLGYNLRLTGEKAEARKAFARVLEIDAHQEAAKLYLDALPAAEAGTDEGAGKEPPAAEPEAADRKDG